MGDRHWRSGIGVLVLGLSSLTACNLEVNIHLDGADEGEGPAPLVTDPPAVLFEGVPTPSAPPTAEVAPEGEGVIRDALWRPTAPRVGLDRSPLSPDGRRLRFQRGRDFVAAPRLLNADDLAATARDAYPPLLLDAGIEGTAEVEVHVNEEGRVGAVDLAETSGYQSLDQAALKIAFVQRFEPARDADGAPVAVWIVVPITFQAR